MDGAFCLGNGNFGILVQRLGSNWYILRIFYSSKTHLIKKKESRKCPKVSNHKPSSTIKGENQSTIINHSALVTPLPLGKDSPASRFTRQAILSDLRRSTHPRFRLLNEALGQLLEDYSLVGVAQCAFGFMFLGGGIFGRIEW